MIALLWREYAQSGARKNTQTNTRRPLFSASILVFVSSKRHEISAILDLFGELSIRIDVSFHETLVGSRNSSAKVPY